jgi:hypothetical protein
MRHCEGVTIANLTFADCRSYGVKVEAENGPKDVHIYNCRFRDIGVRAVERFCGTGPECARGERLRPLLPIREYQVPPADWLYGGDYISAIDMMASRGLDLQRQRLSRH